MGFPASREESFNSPNHSPGRGMEGGGPRTAFSVPSPKPAGLTAAVVPAVAGSREQAAVPRALARWHCHQGQSWLRVQRPGAGVPLPNVNLGKGRVDSAGPARRLSPWRIATVLSPVRTQMSRPLLEVD